MLRTSAAIGIIALLSACGDPLEDVPRISDVALADTDPAAQALPTDEEIAREGFFGTPAASGAQTLPLPSQPRPKPTTRRSGGFFGALRGALPATPPEDRIAIGADDPVAAALRANGAVGPAPVERPSATAGVPPTPAAPNETVLASLEEPPTTTSDPIVKTAPSARAQPRGLFGRLTGGGGQASGASKNAPGKTALPEVDYGTLLPPGVVARSCAAKRQPLGKQVESAQAPGYKLYDSNPGISGPRTFYITGFDDGCPRQLTAAHVLFGSPSFYELLHYGPTGKHLTLAETDAAYEKVKSRVCGARKGKPCGSKMRVLERKTVFVNGYVRPDDNTSWSEILIHDSEIVATSEKTSG